MKVHYFQRYHDKENVATSNTLLLLSRLYSFSPSKFYELLKTQYFSNLFEPEIEFNLQEKRIDSVPDATITQRSFKIVVETKMSDWFYSGQLVRHLKAFDDEQYKVLITLAPTLMEQDKKDAFEVELAQYNSNQQHPVLHINTTFAQMADAIQDVLDDRDYEMQDILEDYLNYCSKDGLIVVSDSWKHLRVQLAGTTIKFNIQENVYYDNIDRGFRAHDYLGLYTQKSVRAIGKIKAIITTNKTNDGLEFKAEQGELNEELKQKILHCIKDGKNYGYKLEDIRYFFVDQFYETDFKKNTPRAPMGSRIFDLTKILDTDSIPEPEKIADILKNKTWR